MEEVTNTSAGQKPQVSAPSGKGGGNAFKTIIIIVIILIGLGVAGYFGSRYVMKRFAEETTEKIIENETGADIEISSAKWPSTMPSDVPEYKDGKIVSSIEGSEGSDKSWSVMIQNTSLAKFNDYKTLLSSNGWSTATSATSSGAGIGSFTKGNFSIVATFSADKNEVAISVTETGD